MDSNDLFVTAASNAERPLTEDVPACNLDLEGPESAIPEEFVEASPTNPETEAMQENSLVENMSSSQKQQNSSGQPNVVSGDNTTPVLTAGSFLVESSSTDESCGEYIVRKWAQLGCSAEVGTSSQGGGTADKFSESAVIELAPGQDVARQEEMETDSVSEVAFLDSPKLPLKSNLKSRYGPPEAKALKLSIKLGNESRVMSVAADVVRPRLRVKMSFQMISGLLIPGTKSDQSRLPDFVVTLDRIRKDSLDRLLLMRCLPQLVQTYSVYAIQLAILR